MEAVVIFALGGISTRILIALKPGCTASAFCHPQLASVAFMNLFSCSCSLWRFFCRYAHEMCRAARMAL